MLESKHPLLLFGIPGIVLFLVGYKLSGNVLDTFDEWNQTSVGVGLAVVGVTLMGLFAMMVGLILIWTESSLTICRLGNMFTTN